VGRRRLVVGPAVSFFVSLSFEKLVAECLSSVMAHHCSDYVELTTKCSLPAELCCEGFAADSSQEKLCREWTGLCREEPVHGNVAVSSSVEGKLESNESSHKRSDTAGEVDNGDAGRTLTSPQVSLSVCSVSCLHPCVCGSRSHPCDLWLIYILRTMCGSRTGGWSLPGVMSD
jgi:hypothetical protein